MRSEIEKKDFKFHLTWYLIRPRRPGKQIRSHCPVVKFHLIMSSVLKFRIQFHSLLQFFFEEFATGNAEKLFRLLQPVAAADAAVSRFGLVNLTF